MSRLAQSIENEAEEVVEKLGGAKRLRIILMLAAILGLDLADKAAVSAISAPLKHALSLGNTEFGTLLAVVSFTGALMTFPAGVLADRLCRRRVLIVVVAMWSVAMAASGLASSFGWLLVSRFFLGTLTAAAWPSIASLTGDFFPPAERARTYGLIISGELVGTAIGFLIASEAASLVNWHWAFYSMAVPSLLLVAVLWKFLPEPKRGGQGWLSSDEHGDFPEPREDAQLIAEKRDIEPDARLLVGPREIESMTWLQVMAHCLKIASYRRLVLASALIYFFFSGVRAFGMLYFAHHLHLSHQMVMMTLLIIGAGALAGVIGGGQLSGALIARGRLTTRVLVPAISLFVTLPFLGFGIWLRNPWLAIGLLTVGAAALGVGIAPIDAARLDVVNAPLWGRSKSGRAALRYLFEGAAPILFGAISGLFGAAQSPLMWTFLIVLSSLLAAGAICVPLRRSYPRDVATAAASARSRRDEADPEPAPGGPADRDRKGRR